MGSPEEKRRYEELANQDKIRFAQEMEQYKMNRAMEDAAEIHENTQLMHQQRLQQQQELLQQQQQQQEQLYQQEYQQQEYQQQEYQPQQEYQEHHQYQQQQEYEIPAEHDQLYVPQIPSHDGSIQYGIA